VQKYVVVRTALSAQAAPGLNLAVNALDVPPPTLAVAELTSSEAAELALEPDVAAVAPSMPTRLIKPLDTGPAAGADIWGLDAVGAIASPFTGAGISVAVLDTGIDAAHPAFAGLDIVQQDFTGDGDGDVEGHGTHCAGTIFGRQAAPRIGVAPGVSRAVIGKVLDNSGSGSSEMLFDAFQWALRERVHVISMSLGFDLPGLVQRLINGGWPPNLAASAGLEIYAANLRVMDTLMDLAQVGGVLGRAPVVVAATGNESEREVNPDFRIAASLPSSARNVISVAAVGRAAGSGFGVAPFSNSQAVVAAPGVGIISAKPGGGLASASGTSMACPHVAGIAALWWEKVLAGPGMKTAQIVTARMLAATRTDVFANFDAVDLGQGLVTAPT
jgi:subtilisin family serine protease